MSEILKSVLILVFVIVGVNIALHFFLNFSEKTK